MFLKCAVSFLFLINEICSTSNFYNCDTYSYNYFLRNPCLPKQRQQRSPGLICPNGWQLSNFGCFSDSNCQTNGRNGVCRQQRCCFRGSTPPQNCLSNEHNTGQQCWNNNHCSFGSIWGAAVCRNGFCCEPVNTNINQPTPACEQGIAIATSCTHDTQCWLQSNQPNQLGICQNGHCCIQTCRNGGRPVGRQCSRNAQDCVYLHGNQYLFGVCDQNVCCSLPSQQGNLNFG